MGLWRVELDLVEHSPPSFIDAKLVIDLPPPSLNALTTAANASQASDLISLTPPPDNVGGPALSPRSSRSTTPSHTSKDKSKIELRLSSTHRLAYRDSDIVETWTEDDGSTFTNSIVVPLDGGPGAELLYE